MTELLVLADLMEEWAGAVPRWDPQAGERWDDFAHRRFEIERALRSRLRRLPTCIVRTDLALANVELALAGIRVEARVSLDAACRAWAAEARRRVAPDVGSQSDLREEAPGLTAEPQPEGAS